MQSYLESVVRADEQFALASGWEIVDVALVCEPTGQQLEDYLVLLDEARGNDQPRCEWDENRQRFVDPQYASEDPLDVLTPAEREDLEFAMQTGDPDGIFVGSVVVHGSGRDYDPADVVRVLRHEAFLAPTSTFDTRHRADIDLREQIDAVEPWHAEKLTYTVWDDVAAERAHSLRVSYFEHVGCWENFASYHPDRWVALCKLTGMRLRDEARRRERTPWSPVRELKGDLATSWMAVNAQQPARQPEFASSPEPSQAWYQALDAAICEREARQAREMAEPASPVPTASPDRDRLMVDGESWVRQTGAHDFPARKRRGTIPGFLIREVRPQLPRGCELQREMVTMKGKTVPVYHVTVPALDLADRQARMEAWWACHGPKVDALLDIWDDDSDRAASDAEYVIRHLGWERVVELIGPAF